MENLEGKILVTLLFGIICAALLTMIVYYLFISYGPSYGEALGINEAFRNTYSAYA